jgi:hypothetical protein
MKRSSSIIILLILSSGLFAQKQDTVKHKIIKQWSLSQDFSEEVELPFDTVFSFFHRYRTADRFSPVNATLGNYGLPFYQFSFFDRVTEPDNFLTSTYYPFLFLPERAVFMNTQKPFSELVWSFAGPRETSEQTFRIRHSQNVNRYLNFGLIYDIIYSLGQYNYQRAENKDFTLFSSYTGPKYKLYFSAGLNNIISYENGGITDLNDLENDKTREVPVTLGSLNRAQSFLKNRNLLLVQRYTIGGNAVNQTDTIPQKKQGFFGLSGTFSHIFTIESNKRTYSDNSPGSGFYDTVFINKSVTFDSLSARSIKNTIRFDFTTNEDRKFRLGGGAGIRNEMFRYGQIVPYKDSLLKADTVVWNRSNNVLVGRLYNNIGDKFRWLATGELFLTGYRSGDLILNGEISKSFDWKKGSAIWLITGSLGTRQPSFWYENWGSNHFKWTNNLDKEIRVDAGTRFSYPARKAEIKFNYAIIDNYTDFGPDATPSQHSGGISIAAITLSKDLHLWKFHLATDLILQKSSNTDIIDLPLATTRSAAYFEHLFRFKSTNGRLNLQVGADATYNTMYHPYAYMPATGRFYRQDQVSTGNYPFVNVFLNFKVKRTRVFVMLDHLNAKLMGYNFDMIPSYPMNIRMFRYGIAWTFYD